MGRLQLSDRTQFFATRHGKEAALTHDIFTHAGGDGGVNFNGHLCVCSDDSSEVDVGDHGKMIKIHRGRVMEKMGVTSVADLVRLAQATGVAPMAVA